MPPPITKPKFTDANGNSVKASRLVANNQAPLKERAVKAPVQLFDRTKSAIEQAAVSRDHSTAGKECRIPHARTAEVVLEQRVEKAFEANPTVKVPGLRPDETDLFPDLSSDDRLRLDMFVRHYMKCFSVRKAATLCGASPASAGVEGLRMSREPYTLWAMQRYVDSMDEKDIVTRKDVLLGLRKEALAEGPDATHAGRIAAWKTIGKFIGMEVIKVEGEVKHFHAVMQVPAVTGEEEWGQAAAGSQKRLKEAVRV